MSRRKPNPDAPRTALSSYVYLRDAYIEALKGTNFSSVHDAVKAGHLTDFEWCEILARHRAVAEEAGTIVQLAHGRSRTRGAA
ncbi:hypothetical protein [Deinococcus pimensis]|uniref:hypothetical protein n=1 Tax=Deinococcus pimensis TaxID=309888 RepID=UPI000485FC26|nr:hypothetical protein [Deinococcus pimensis]